MLLMLDLDDGNKSNGLDWGMRTACRCSKVDPRKDRKKYDDSNKDENQCNKMKRQKNRFRLE